MLACGHHESNMVKTVEAGTEFCRQCDIESRCRDAESREKELFAENQKLRDMLAARTGEGDKPTSDAVRDAIGRIARIRTGAEKSQDIYDVDDRNVHTACLKVMRAMRDDERTIIDDAIMRDALTTPPNTHAKELS